MNRKLRVGVPLTGLAVLFAVTTVVAQQSGASPDGLQPPAGPVSDTQPSLTTISAQLDQLLTQGTTGFPDGLLFRHTSINEDEIELISAAEADFVRIYSVIIEGAGTNLRVGPNDEVVAILGGDSHNSQSELIGHNQFQFGGLRVPTPVSIVESGSMNNGSFVTLLYWIDEE